MTTKRLAKTPLEHANKKLFYIHETLIVMHPFSIFTEIAYTTMRKTIHKNISVFRIFFRCDISNMYFLENRQSN